MYFIETKPSNTMTLVFSQFILHFTVWYIEGKPIIEQGFVY